MNRKDSHISSDRRRKRAEDMGEKLSHVGDAIGHIYAWNVMPLVGVFQRLRLLKVS